jgi:Skp family chaperone for outer membrane proteins|tara:strand:+ start:2263 stop:2778 length:516 start_codon:yes stop_codon:yes gene_type:complete
MKKLILITILLMGYSFNSNAENPHFIDFSKVLNASKPGAEAQKKLKNKFQSESVKFNKIEDSIKKEEAELISQKKLLSPEDYQKKVKALRKKVSDLQKNKKNSFNGIAKSRGEAKKKLLNAVNPIIQKYMEENEIKIVLDKQSIVLGDKNLEITDKIILILNKELPSLKIN